MVVANPAGLRIENSRLVIKQEADIPLPLEDIAVLMLDSPEVTLTSSVLIRLADQGAMIIACGPNHLPALAGLPFTGHSRASGVQRMQLSSTLPFRKRCWQKVVQAKIRNQAECLRILDKKGAEGVASLAENVMSGDSGNVESQAARRYFARLFGPDFERREEDGINAALNYGYAVLRAAVARSLAAHGFLLTQGIHHRSELNPFNLADDFLEPFRPMADLAVASFAPPPEALEKSHKASLVSLLGSDIQVEGAAYTMLRAADMAAASFLAATKAGDPRLLILPKLLPLQNHEYE